MRVKCGSGQGSLLVGVRVLRLRVDRIVVGDVRVYSRLSEGT